METTWRRRALWLASIFAAVSVLGAVAGLSVGRAKTRLAGTETTADQSAAGSATTAQTITGSTTTAPSTTSPTTTTNPTTTTSPTTTTRSTTSPASRPPVCQACAPVIDIGAVTRPLLGFGYGGRRFPNGGIELVAVIITGDDNPAISRFTIRLPGPLSRDLPDAKRHLIRVESGHVEVSGRTLTVTLPKSTTAETVTIPAAAMASSLSVKRRLVFGLTFQVHQRKLSRRLGSDVAIG